jgi:hypothetical protein
VLLAGSLGTGAGLAPPPAAADPVPTMTFKGVSLLGLLDSIAVTPSSLSVPSGGTVTFVNAAGVRLTLNVGGQSYALDKSGTGASRTFAFNGGTAPQAQLASATALNIPLVGTLTSPTGTINVAAAPQAPETSQPPGPPQLTPLTGGTGSDPAAGTPTPAGAPVPQALPNGPARPPNLGRDPVARGGMASAGLRAIVAERAGSSATQNLADASTPTVRSAARTPDGVMTTVGGGIGLLILVATVLLGGVGSAAIRAVLAQRNGPVRT